MGWVLRSPIERLRCEGDVAGLLELARDVGGRHRDAALRAAFESLGEPARSSPHAEEVSSTCRVLVHDEDHWLRGLAIGGLCATRDPEAVPYTVAALNDPEPFVRSQALLGLGSMLPDGCVSAVVPLLDDDDPVIRSCAAQVLARLGDSSVLETLRSHRDREQDELPSTSLTEAIRELESGDRGGES